MRYLLAALCLAIGPGVAVADMPAGQPAAIRATIDRGLKFLVSDAQAWRSEHNCVSCHHAGLVIWSLREAKQRGITVDEPALAELTRWTAETGGDGTTGVPRPEGKPCVLNEKAISLALAIAADAHPDEVCARPSNDSKVRCWPTRLRMARGSRGPRRGRRSLATPTNGRRWSALTVARTGYSRR